MSSPRLSFLSGGRSTAFGGSSSRRSSSINISPANTLSLLPPQHAHRDSMTSQISPEILETSDSRRKDIRRRKPRLWQAFSEVTNIRTVVVNLQDRLQKDFDYITAVHLLEILDFQIATLPDDPVEQSSPAVLDQSRIVSLLCEVCAARITTYGSMPVTCSREIQLRLIVTCLLLLQALGITHFDDALKQTLQKHLNSIQSSVFEELKMQTRGGEVRSFDSWFLVQFARDALNAIQSARGKFGRITSQILSISFAAGYVYTMNGHELMSAMDNAFAAIVRDPSKYFTTLSFFMRLSLMAVALQYKSKIEKDDEARHWAQDLAMKITEKISEEFENHNMKEGPLARLSESAFDITASSGYALTNSTNYFPYGLLYLLHILIEAFPSVPRVVDGARSLAQKLVQGRICESERGVLKPTADILRMKALEIFVAGKHGTGIDANEEQFEKLMQAYVRFSTDWAYLAKPAKQDELLNKYKTDVEKLRQKFKHLRQYMEFREAKLARAVTEAEVEMRTNDQIFIPPSLDRPVNQHFVQIHVQPSANAPGPEPDTPELLGTSPLSSTVMRRGSSRDSSRMKRVATIPEHEYDFPNMLTPIATPVMDSAVSSEEAFLRPVSPNSETTSPDLCAPSPVIGSPPTSNGSTGTHPERRRRESRSSGGTRRSGIENIAEWKEEEVRPFNPECYVEKLKAKPKPSSRRFSIKLSSGPVWYITTISPDGRYVCLLSPSHLDVFEVNGSGDERIPVFTWKLPKHCSRGEAILDGALSNTGKLAVITHQKLFVLEFHNEEVIPFEYDASDFAKQSRWDHRCLCISPDGRTIVVGLRQAVVLAKSDIGVYTGKLRVFRQMIQESDSMPNVEYAHQADVEFPEMRTASGKVIRDTPKVLSFSKDGWSFSCSTVISSLIFVWKTETLEIMSKGRLEITHESGVEGITSMTILRRRANYPYLVVTVSNRTKEHQASTTIMPITKDELPSTNHMLRHRPEGCRNGYCSTSTYDGRAVAVLDRQGKITIFNTKRHQVAGLQMVYAAQLSESLAPVIVDNDNKSSRIMFSTDGKKLIGADRTGKIVVFQFDAPLSPVPLTPGPFDLGTEPHPGMQMVS